MKVRKFLVIFFLILLFSFSTNNYIKSVGVYLKRIQLYESDFGELIKKKREYKTTFNKSETRYINWEIDLSHPGRTKDFNFPITAIYSTADSIEVYKQNMDILIKGKWPTSYHYYGFGWKKPGMWEPGVYNINFYIEDEYVGTSDFEIIDDMNLKYINSIDVYLEYVKLFENDGNNIRKENRIYNNKFPKKTSRIISWELGFQHPNRNVERNYKIESIYYNSSNQIIDKFTNDFTIQKKWDSSYFYSGWGYPEFNRWEIGKYKIELYLNEELISVKEFEIY